MMWLDWKASLASCRRSFLLMLGLSAAPACGVSQNLTLFIC